ncbi:MAG: formate dehydrogenase accessory sulfurtransferase FdhD [Acinetobacter sp.]
MVHSSQGLLRQMHDLSKYVETTSQRTVEQHVQQQVYTRQEYVIEEVPVALVYNGISHAVMMMTGANLIEFALGFSLSEGILPDLSALYKIDVKRHTVGFTVEMEISSAAFFRLKQQRRNLVGRSGCGLCGIDSLQQFQQPIAKITTPVQIDWLNDIEHAVAALAQRQPITQQTGAAHAAAWIEQGMIQAVFEDVGRHNALDKLLGYISLQNIDISKGFVLMTSRASYELIQKCVKFNIALLATISAPSSLAIDLAQRAGMTLASFCREQRFSLYSYPQEVDHARFKHSDE